MCVQNFMATVHHRIMLGSMEPSKNLVTHSRIQPCEVVEDKVKATSCFINNSVEPNTCGFERMLAINTGLTHEYYLIA